MPSVFTTWIDTLATVFRGGRALDRYVDSQPLPRTQTDPIADVQKLLDEAPRAGARWMRRADGTWHRWSYLGGAWEPEPAPPPQLAGEAAVLGAERQWLERADGVFEPVEGEPEAVTLASHPVPATDAGSLLPLPSDEPIVEQGPEQGKPGAADVLATYLVVAALVFGGYLALWLIAAIASMLLFFLFEGDSPIHLTRAVFFDLSVVTATVGAITSIIRWMIGGHRMQPPSVWALSLMFCGVIAFAGVLAIVKT